MSGFTDHTTLEATDAAVVPFGVGDTQLLIRTIRELSINAISCTPSYPMVLERVVFLVPLGVTPFSSGHYPLFSVACLSLTFVEQCGELQGQGTRQPDHGS